MKLKKSTTAVIFAESQPIRRVRYDIKLKSPKKLFSWGILVIFADKL